MQNENLDAARLLDFVVRGLNIWRKSAFLPRLIPMQRRALCMVFPLGANTRRAAYFRQLFKGLITELVTKPLSHLFSVYGGERGIRTPGRALQPYNGLANRRLQPLGHLSVSDPIITESAPPCGSYGGKCGRN